MKVTASIWVELKVSGTVVPITPGSQYVRALADSFVRINETDGSFGDISLARFSPDFQRAAMEALEAAGRKLVTQHQTDVQLTTI